MLHTPPTTYQTQALTDRQNSPEFHALIARKSETQAREEFCQDLLFFAEEEFEMSEQEKKDLKTLLNAFIGYDPQKAEAGERAMLARWISATQTH